MDPTSFDELRPGTYDVRAARARHVGERRARLAQLPVAARASRAACSPRSTTRTPRSRSAARTTTGTSRSGAAPRPTASSRSRSRRSGIPTRCADEVRRVDEEGLSRDHVPREPRAARTAEPAQRALGPVLAGVQRRGHDRQHAHRFVVEARDHRARRTRRRDDHAAADEHRAGRGRPHLLAGVQEVPRRHRRALRRRDRLDPLLPRAARPHVQGAQGVDVRRLRRQAAEPGVHGARRSSASSKTTSARATRARSAPTASASRPTTRTATRSGPTRPNG